MALGRPCLWEHAMSLKLSKTKVACLAAAIAIGAASISVPALARGGGGWHGGGGGGGWRGAAWHGRFFPHRHFAFFHHRRFFGPFVGLYASGYSSCWSWVPTAWGWRQVWVCGPYGWGGWGGGVY